MITTRDIKVFIFSILFSTLCYALFNQPLKSAEAQGGGMPPMGAPGMGAPGMAPPGGGRDICREHATIAGEKHDEILERIQGHINGAIENHNRTYDATINHATIAGEKHDAILAKLDELLSR
jgi:hypothetical protein